MSVDFNIKYIKFNIPTPVMNTTTCESTVFYFEFSCFFRMGRIKTGSLVSAALLRDAFNNPNYFIISS